MIDQNIKNNNTVYGKRLMLGYIGLFLIYIGVITFLPIITIIFYHDNSYAWWFFFVPAVISTILGCILYIPIRNKNYGKLSSLENLFLTLTIWLLAIFISAIPYFIWGQVGGPNKPVVINDKGVIKIIGEYLPGGKNHAYNNYFECLFETVSGYSSTGLTLFPTYTSPAGNYLYNHIFTFNAASAFEEYLPNCEIFLFHRGIMTFTGGVGLVLILSSAINKKSNVQLYLLEGHSETLLPNLLKSARLIIFIYLGMFIFGVALFTILGVSFFDAICYTMAGVSTGGFASHAMSIRFFSLALGDIRGRLIEISMIIIMFLGMLPFVAHFFILKGKIKKFILNYETFVFILFVIICFPIFTYGMYQKFNNYDQAFRYSSFEFVSFISTSGFSSLDGYKSNQINSYLYFIMIILSLVGGFSGSTAGGIKLYRIGDVFVSIKKSFSSMTSINEEVKATRVYKFGNSTIVEDKDLKKSLDYVLVYMICVVICVCILICNNFSFMDSLFEVASAFAGLGVSAGLSYQAAINHQWMVISTLSVAMFLGRLEILIVFISIAKLFKRISKRKNIYHPAN